LRKIRILIFSAQAGKKGKGLGKGIFARPRFLIFSPPQNFVPILLARTFYKPD
jgi:hypothetical protein